MTTDEFAAWLATMKEIRGWTRAECARQLGAGVNQMKVWSSVRPPPKYIHLATRYLSAHG